MSLKRIKQSDAKRGDTIIEAMFAFAIFSLVSIITVSMMNLGIATNERSLELVTARNELNAQAEALRFIHSSYVSELSLPNCGSADMGENGNCQQYAEVWRALTSGAIEANDNKIEYPLTTCSTVYESNNKLLADNNAFVVNTRKLFAYKDAVPSDVIVRTGRDDDDIFRAAPLNARLIYTSNELGGDPADSSDSLPSKPLTTYKEISGVEGIWVFAVKGPKTQYYDFFIQTCWYGSNNAAPTPLDTVIRLYNPEGK